LFFAIILGWCLNTGFVDDGEGSIVLCDSEMWISGWWSEESRQCLYDRLTFGSRWVHCCTQFVWFCF